MTPIFYKSTAHNYPGRCYYSIIANSRDIPTFEDGHTLIVIHHPNGSGTWLMNTETGRNEIINRIIQHELPNCSLATMHVIYNLMSSYPGDDTQSVYELNFREAFKEQNRYWCCDLTFGNTGIYVDSEFAGRLSIESWAAVSKALLKLESEKFDIVDRWQSLPRPISQ